MAEIEEASKDCGADKVRERRENKGKGVRARSRNKSEGSKLHLVLKMLTLRQDVGKRERPDSIRNSQK